MTTFDQPRWAHEDPKALALLRRIGTATSAADRGTARDELQDYLLGDGRHLEMNIAEFGAAHLARVDRQAWNLAAPDQDRGVPQWKLDQQLHTDYHRYAELIDHAAHGENEVDRGQFARRAEELREYWQMTAPREWQQLRELQQQWAADPATARELTTAELRHNPEPNRHLAWAQTAFDPQVREREQWEQMHNRLSDLNAEKYLAASESEIDEIDARMQQVRGDQDKWPTSWHEFEEEVADDPEWHRDQSERTGERYAEIVAERERAQQRPVSAFAVEADRDGLDR